MRKHLPTDKTQATGLLSVPQAWEFTLDFLSLWNKKILGWKNDPQILLEPACSQKYLTPVICINLTLFYSILSSVSDTKPELKSQQNAIWNKEDIMFHLNRYQMKKKINSLCCTKEINQRQFEEHCFRSTKGQKNLKNSLNFSDANHVSVH